MLWRNPFRGLTKFEWALWLISVWAVTLSSLVRFDVANLAVSLLGVTSLIFVARGDVFGQFITVAFSLLYGVISLFSHYYGETIIYFCMQAPIAVLTIVTWLRHSHKAGGEEVEVRSLPPRAIPLLVLATAAVTGGFFFLLRALGTENLAVSTISVATSFGALSLLVLRSPYYAVVFALNDVVLIVLWTLEVVRDIAFLPMVVCFVMFLCNDIYGFCNWIRIRRRQALEKAAG